MDRQITRAKKLLFAVARPLAAFPSLRRRIPESLRVRFAKMTVGVRHDRLHLEEAILPAVARAGYSKVLWVGCKRYTSHYGAWFLDSGAEFWTCDIDIDSARWGEEDRHVVCDVTELDSHFAADSFDAVLLNSVFGWGVNDEASMNRALSAIHSVLRRQGVLLIGWDTGMISDPLRLEKARELFRRETSLPLPARRIIDGVSVFSDSEHVFDFLEAN